MDLRQVIQSISHRLKVTGVLCGRSVKTDRGEIFVAFQADCLSPESSMSEEGSPESGVSFSVKESRVAAYLLALQTDIAAHEHALASGLISQQFCKDTVSSLKTRYSALISNEFEGDHE